jgi:hypothetical protein
MIEVFVPFACRFDENFKVCFDGFLSDELCEAFGAEIVFELEVFLGSDRAQHIRHLVVLAFKVLPIV